MGTLNLETLGVSIAKLSKFDVPSGDVFHGLKASESAFAEFGETYFSFIEFGAVKGWKRHNSMLMNLVVPIGAVKFVLSKDAEHESPEFVSVTLSPDNYCRLTVPPGIWMAFTGRSSGKNMIVNIASIEHDPLESDNLDVDAVAYDWSK